jgi:uncharacterized membrane protein
MSLKNFHIFFVITATVLSWLTAYLCLAGLPDAGSPGLIVLGLICLAAGIVLPIYGRYFYKKMVKLGFYK